jgi:FdhD protein
MFEALKEIEIVRVRDRRQRPDVDRVAAEEPLEVRLHGRPFAVIMRTPGADLALTAGFLLAERVLKSADDLATIEHCREQPTPDASDEDLHPENVVNVMLAGGSAAGLEQAMADRRQVLGNSSCGLCGRLTIASLKTDVAPLTFDRRVNAATIARLPDGLREAQAVFKETGGIHAAGLFTVDGAVEAVAEDVGRHNAVDKVIGQMLLADRLPLSDLILFVSGRTSFEIVQKAALAGLPMVGAVSAPSSLAVELAREVGITLIGFTRGGSFNIYSHPERVS